MEENTPAAFGRLCVETLTSKPFSLAATNPAAFGRLCVETKKQSSCFEGLNPAAFGRLCVETIDVGLKLNVKNQPPSGGCVLKLGLFSTFGHLALPAAFGRLCVETLLKLYGRNCQKPAAFGRLCVETTACLYLPLDWVPAAFGRLCVETELLNT